MGRARDRSVRNSCAGGTKECVAAFVFFLFCFLDFKDNALN